ncbi:MAG: ISL3 family transposase [Cyanothece sp. SIO2G6]|nr:ISL3 family transposase [Cyanothece sp. SIO2G6]
MQPLLTELLNLEGMEVETYSNCGDHLTLVIEAKTTCSTCPRCGEESHSVHQNHWHLSRDLKISDKDVFLKYNRRQFKCKTCGKPFSESLAFIGDRKHYTDRFAELVVKDLIHGDIHNVAKKHNITDDLVGSMLEYLSKKKWKFDPSRIKRLGIDEIALKKGQKDFVVVLVDLDRNELVGVVESRTHKAIQKELESWGDQVLKQIQEVSIDLSGNYRGLIHKLMPDAEIVADRFHVSKLINDALNNARIAEKKRLQDMADEVEKKRLNDILSKSKYVLLKSPDKLNEKQEEKLILIKENFPVLGKMYEQKEAFRDIFDNYFDWTEGAFALMNWMQDAEETYKDSIGTIYRWFTEITAYFETRTTSGAVEGINNRLKLIKRLGYGFRNFDNFCLRCLICWQLDIS